MRNLNIMINEEGFNIHALSGDKKEALKTYQLYGKNMDKDKIDWSGFQKDLRKYEHKPSDRKIIWVVGEKGNEGKTFFQDQIRQEFGYLRFSALQLGENIRNILHVMGKQCSTNTDIFLFNVPRRGVIFTEQYKILEFIKDGYALSGKFQSQNLYFKKPNVLIVFANREPNMKELSKDR